MKILPFLLAFCILIIPSAFAEENVPSWIKNTADWWASALINDNEFVNAIEFLIKEGIIQVDAVAGEKSDNIPDWVRNTKAPNDPVLMAVLDADEFEYAIDRTAYRVARKIYYVGRKPSGMTPEQWDADTAGMRPVEGTYSPTTEHWTNGFPYGPDYEYRTGMFE